MRYRSEDEDSARWLDFPFREGDIVISTRSKGGTTWLLSRHGTCWFGPHREERSSHGYFGPLGSSDRPGDPRR